jgi:predicted nucleotidyltransferase component of viral defense system
MLQYTAVVPSTLELLKLLMKQKCLSDFNLVGGTALALQLGHRISVDLDFFSLHDFDGDVILFELQKIFNLNVTMNKANQLMLNVEYPPKSDLVVKLDILKYPYPLISSIINFDDIRLLAIEDIIPMKLSAIANRGAKKDFYDIYFLLKPFSLKEMLSLFSQKFPNISHFHLLKSLVYFDDADEDANPKLLIQISWGQVKTTIEKEVMKVL